MEINGKLSDESDITNGLVDNIKQEKWDARFIQMSYLVASWSSCISRQVGAVIVKNKRTLTTGYNGAPSGVKSCVERDECLRKKLNVPSGASQEIGYAIHAEQNAIVQAAKLGIAVDKATIYCTHQPCSVCAKLIINSGIVRVVYAEGYPDEFAMQLFKESGVEIVKHEQIKNKK